MIISFWSFKNFSSPSTHLRIVGYLLLANMGSLSDSNGLIWPASGLSLEVDGEDSSLTISKTLMEFQ